jgi:competence protein ComEA
VTPEPRILNLNEATAIELQQLPAIGQELAGRIVKYREGVGGFRTLDELKQVRGIGDKLFEKIRAYLTL